MNELFSPANQEVKERLDIAPDLMILDMDGTIVIEPEFYKSVYSQSLYDTVLEERGEEGIRMVDYYRANFENNGHFALAALAISFRKWAEKLCLADLSGITPRPDIVEKVRKMTCKKVVFTGSPKTLALSILTRFGFDPEKDFDDVIGWEEPELWPLKWNCSPFVFKSICDRFQVNYLNAWAVGDNWQTDLAPARTIGMQTIQIQRNTGVAEKHFENFSKFIQSIEAI